MTSSRLKKFIFSEPIKFLKGGVGMKAVSFLLNYLLADLLQLNVELTYVFVLVVDLIMGYFVNRYFVFKTEDKGHKEVIKNFLIAGVTFRALNWGIYVLILRQIEMYILIAQFIATAVVLVLKFFVYKRIFR